MYKSGEIDINHIFTTYFKNHAPKDQLLMCVRIRWEWVLSTLLKNHAPLYHINGESLKNGINKEMTYGTSILSDVKINKDARPAIPGIKNKPKWLRV